MWTDIYFLLDWLKYSPLLRPDVPRNSHENTDPICDGSSLILLDEKIFYISQALHLVYGGPTNI